MTRERPPRTTDRRLSRVQRERLDARGGDAMTRDRVDALNRALRAAAPLRGSERRAGAWR
jgi:hypothetical protein